MNNRLRRLRARRIGDELRVHRSGLDGVSQRQHARHRCRHADDRAQPGAELGGRRARWRGDGAALRQLRRSKPQRSGGDQRDRRGDGQPGHGQERRRCCRATSTFLWIRPAAAGQGDGAPDRLARQSRVDADRPVFRRGHRRHRRDGDGRSVAGERDDLRQAVHDSRQVEGGADAAVGRRRHLRRVRQQGQSAGEPGRLHSGDAARLYRLQPGGQRGERLVIRAATGHNITVSFYYSLAIGKPVITGGADYAGTSPTATRRFITGATRCRRNPAR